jgi:hypothetical protein
MRLGPPQPAAEQLADARLAARGGQRRPHDFLDKLSGREIEQLHLQGFLRFEVGEQATLREVELLGERADRHALQADATRQGRSTFENRLSCQLTAAHGQSYYERSC